MLLDETPLEDDVALLAIESLPLEDTLEMTLPARPDVLGGLRNTLGRWLCAAGASENELFDITLSASEAATNAIEHAYGAREATFTVRCEHDGQQVTVTVSDSGRWRTARPHGGGRGLEIMRSLVDNVDVDSGEDGTIVTITKRLSRPAMSPLDIERIDGVPVVHVARRHRRGERRDRRNSSLPTRSVPTPDSLIVDLSDTRYLDSAGIDMLLRLADRLDHRRAKLILVIPDGSQLKRLAAIVGLPEAIAIQPTLSAALQEAAKLPTQTATPRPDPGETTAGRPHA